jgi:hypothetical protein
VNVGIKSGTNTIHGAAYAFGRTRLGCPQLIQPRSREQLPAELAFGGVVGGHIKKDKLFYFAGCEGLRSFLGNPLGSSVPQSGPG